jgi:hypothetical protein
VVVWAIIANESLDAVTGALGVSSHSDAPFYVVFFGVPVVLFYLLLRRNSS